MELLQALDVLRRYLGAQINSDATDEWIDISDRAATKTSRKTLRKAITAGELPANKVGKTVLVRRADLDRYIRGHRVKAPTDSKVTPLINALGKSRRAANG